MSNAQPVSTSAIAACMHHLDGVLGEPPQGAGIVLWCKDTRQHEAFQSVEQAAHRAVELDSVGREVYFSTGIIAVSDWQRPTRTNAATIARKCFHVDVDVAKPGASGVAYLGAGPAAKALIDWAKLRGLYPGMTLLSSGGGFHVYWCLDELVPPAAWRDTAAQLDRLLKADGILADHAVTADISRLLRPAGTHNRKTPVARDVAVVLSEGRKAGMLAGGAAEPWATVSHAAFSERLREGLAAHGLSGQSALASVAVLTTGTNADLGGGLRQRAETPDNIAWVQRRLDSIPADCDRTTWRDVVFGIHSTGWTCARDLAEAWSRRGESFDEGEFSKLWSSARADVAGVTLGTVDAIAKRCGFNDGAPANRASPLGTDVWHAEQFALAYSGRLLHVHSTGAWVAWNGNNWEHCAGGEAMQYMVSYGRTVTAQACNLARERGANDGGALAALKDAQRMASARAMQSVLSLAATFPSISVDSPGEFDADPWLLGVQNGIVDLRTGHHLAPDPARMILRTCGAAYDPGAQCPGWLRFLGDVFHEDAETIGYVQRLCGLMLTGDVSDEVLHFMHGHGANGKSVFANVLRHVVGGYCYVAQSDLLVKDDRRGSGGPSPDVVNMAGARLVMVNETGAGDRLDEVRMKSLASTEAVTARTLYGNPFTFKPTAKLLVRGNFKPIVQSSDHGTWRRLRLIPFTRAFQPDECDPHLEARLLSEQDGILGWMLEGTRLWRAQRLKPSGAIAAASAGYRSEMDLVGQWIADECDTGVPGAESPQGALFTSYEFWCSRAGMRPMVKNSFSRELEAKGFPALRRQHLGKRQTLHKGIQLCSSTS